ncbi:hypothetical protein FB451DRAFT_1171313 [Mycena latifolia]|nr:hypothetical protein FB451DRAFT_1171313 [Mycena latifolia]
MSHLVVLCLLSSLLSFYKINLLSLADRIEAFLARARRVALLGFAPTMISESYFVNHVKLRTAERGGRTFCASPASGLHVNLTQTGVASLCGLPALASLQIVESIVPAGPQSESVEQRFRLSKLASSDEGLMYLLYPDHLHELNLTGDPHTFMETLGSMPSFSNVHKLSTPTNLPTITEGLLVLAAKFSAVQTRARYAARSSRLRITTIFQVEDDIFADGGNPKACSGFSQTPQFLNATNPIQATEFFDARADIPPRAPRSAGQDRFGSATFTVRVRFGIRTPPGRANAEPGVRFKAGNFRTLNLNLAFGPVRFTFEPIFGPDPPSTSTSPSAGSSSSATCRVPRAQDEIPRPYSAVARRPRLPVSVATGQWRRTRVRALVLTRFCFVPAHPLCDVDSDGATAMRDGFAASWEARARIVDISTAGITAASSPRRIAWVRRKRGKLLVLEDDDNASTYADKFCRAGDVISRERRVDDIKGKESTKRLRDGGRKVRKEMPCEEWHVRWIDGEVNSHILRRQRAPRLRRCTGARLDARRRHAQPARKPARGGCRRAQCLMSAVRESLAALHSPARAGRRASAEPHWARRTAVHARAVTQGEEGSGPRVEGEDAGIAQGTRIRIAPRQACVDHADARTPALTTASAPRTRAPTHRDGARWYAAPGRTAARRAGSRTACTTVLDAQTAFQAPAELREVQPRGHGSANAEDMRCLARDAGAYMRWAPRALGRDGSASSAVAPSHTTRQSEGKKQEKDSPPPCNPAAGGARASGGPEFCVSRKRRERKQRRENEGKEGGLPCAVDRLPDTLACAQAPECAAPRSVEVPCARRSGRERRRGEEAKERRDARIPNAPPPTTSRATGFVPSYARPSSSLSSSTLPPPSAAPHCAEGEELARRKTCHCECEEEGGTLKMGFVCGRKSYTRKCDGEEGRGTFDVGCESLRRMNCDIYAQHEAPAISAHRQRRPSILLSAARVERGSEWKQGGMYGSAIGATWEPVYSADGAGSRGVRRRRLDVHTTKSGAHATEIYAEPPSETIFYWQLKCSWR